MGKSITDVELQDALDSAWDEIYASVPMPIQKGEKTIAMMQEELRAKTGREITDSMMRGIVKDWVASGKLERVPEKRVSAEGRSVAVWIGKGEK